MNSSKTPKTLTSIGEIVYIEKSWDEHVWVSTKPVRFPGFGNNELQISFLNTEDDEHYFEQADTALANFLNLSEETKAATAGALYQIWRDYDELVGCLTTIDVFEQEKSRPDWMQADYERMVGLRNLDSPEKIWGYLSFKEILVTKDPDDASGPCYIVLLFKAIWDDEHAMHIAFKNGQELTIECP